MILELRLVGKVLRANCGRLVGDARSESQVLLRHEAIVVFLRRIDPGTSVGCLMLTSKITPIMILSVPYIEPLGLALWISVASNMRLAQVTLMLD
jgi:hypothetical protein